MGSRVGAGRKVDSLPPGGMQFGPRPSGGAAAAAAAAACPGLLPPGQAVPEQPTTICSGPAPVPGAAAGASGLNRSMVSIGSSITLPMAGRVKGSRCYRPGADAVVLLLT